MKHILYVILYTSIRKQVRIAFSSPLFFTTSKIVSDCEIKKKYYIIFRKTPKVSNRRTEMRRYPNIIAKSKPKESQRSWRSKITKNHERSKSHGAIPKISLQ